MPLQIRFLFIFLFVNSVNAQYFPSKNYTTKDGLPNNAVRALFLDKKGVLWIGTENGVSRKQNGTFYNINKADGLGHNSCWDISQDENGNMWFASYGGGVTKFDGQKFTVFTTKNGLKADKVRKVFPFKNKVYVGTENGISIVDIKTNAILTPSLPDYKEDFISISFFTYREQVYFSALFQGLFKIDQRSKIPKIIPIVSPTLSYALGLFDGNLYSANKGFINKYDIQAVQKKDTASISFGQSIVWQFAKDKREKIYAAAWGVYTPDGGLFSIENNKMIPISDFYGIDSKVLLNVVYDKIKDILYVGSNKKGVYEVRLDKMIDFNKFDDKAIIDFENYGSQKVILHNEGLTFFNSNRIAAQTISLRDFKHAQVAFLKNNTQVEKKQGNESRDFEINFNIPAQQIEFYEIVKNKYTFWVSSTIGIFEINQIGQIISYLPRHSLKIGFSTNDKLIETITYAGVNVYDSLHNLNAKHYSKFNEKTPQYVVKILNTKRKTYLLSVFNGIYTYQNNQFRSYLAEGIWKETKFKHGTINNKGQLVFATEFGNIYVVEDDTKFKIVKTIRKEHLTGNTILFLEAYKDCIFIGTEKGINLYQNGKIRLIDSEQGLKDAEVTTSEIFQNELWLGTQKGYYIVDLQKLLKEQVTVSSIAINKVSIDGKELDKSNYNNFEFSKRKLVCEHNNNSFTIDFIPKGQLFPNKLKFRYRLKNSDRWGPYNDKASLYLSYLPSGKYNIELQVYDANAGKTSIFHLIDIQIKQPFWMTWWFFIAAFLFLFGNLFLLFIRYKNNNREKALIQKRIEQTKLEALLSQMNPHFTFNAMNAIQDFILKKDVDNSLRYIGDFAKLMRMTLENSSKPTISTEEELDYLKLYISLENMRFDNRIHTEFIIAPDLDIYIHRIPTMLLQPFVENVFVHAFDDLHSAPKLLISFEMFDEQTLECKICDNGKGFTSDPTQKKHQSKAIQLAKERLLLLQNKSHNAIVFSETQGSGTTVRIRLQV